MPKIILITGGVKSGKSSYALSRADQYSGKKVFLATAEAFDEGMKERISRHHAERGNSYITVEEPLFLAKKITESGTLQPEVIIVDCLTLWVNNLFFYQGQKGLSLEQEKGAFFKTVSHPFCDIIIVTNEVGLGVYPDNKLAAVFMNALGIMNKAVAQIADEVVFMVSGCPQTIKRAGTNVNSYSKREE